MSTIILNYFFIRSQIALIIAIPINVFILVLFKYIFSNFSVFSFIPLGLSFFIFQQISAVIDQSKKSKDDKPLSFFHYMAYVCFYPQLIAGPIMRLSDFLGQLRERSHPYEIKTTVALCFIIIGLFKKVVIADSVLNYIEPHLTMVQNLKDLNFWTIWNVNVWYVIAIYEDFSGYSEMAVGIGMLIGINLPQNFNSPFRQTNLAHLWRNWHITISLFIRDYLYLPLQKKMNRNSALFVSIFLLSIWHGPTLNFAFFGIYQGMGVLFLRVWSKNKKARCYSHLAHLITLVFFISSLPLFYVKSNDLSSLKVFIAQFQFTNISKVPLLEMLVIIFFFLFFKMAPNTYEYLTLKNKRIRFDYSLFDAVFISLLFLMVIAFLQQSRGYIYFEF